MRKQMCADLVLPKNVNEGNFIPDSECGSDLLDSCAAVSPEWWQGWQRYTVADMKNWSSSLRRKLPHNIQFQQVPKMY